jgi:hypothetical protein
MPGLPIPAGLVFRTLCHRRNAMFSKTLATLSALLGLYTLVYLGAEIAGILAAMLDVMEAAQKAL